MPGFIVRGGVDGQFGGVDNDVAVRSTEEYIYNYTWQIVDLFGTSASDSAIINAKHATLPTFTVGIEKVQGASLEYKFAKNVTWDDVKVTFYDSVGLLKVLIEWRKSVWTAQRGLAMAEEYKKDSRIEVLGPNWDPDKSNTWHLHGSWPSVIRHGDLTYTNSDVKVVEVNVTYDFADEVETLVLERFEE